jgi:hypothetical protein
MTNDHHPAGRVPLPGRGGPGKYRREDSGEWDSRDWDSGDWHGPRGARRDGIGHARRMSNWSAATLIVGTGAAMVALARGAVPAAVPASVPAASTPAAPATPAAKAAKAGKAGTPHSRAAKAGTAASHRAPTASRSVATTSGSHVTSTAAGTAAGQSAPPVSSPVATTSGSGVTTITTTNPVTGKKTVTKVRRGGRGGDD